MTERISEIGQIEGRAEYNQTVSDRLEEYAIITELIDELMAAPGDSGTGLQSASVGEDDIYITRSFRYIEGDTVNGWAWPLVEKTLDISYQRTRRGLITEIYAVKIGTVIHQTLVDDSPIANGYEIGYFGSERRSLTATIQQPNLLDETEPDYTRRLTTPYDQGQLFDELAAFQSMLDASQLENTKAARASNPR